MDDLVQMLVITLVVPVGILILFILSDVMK